MDSIDSQFDYQRDMSAFIYHRQTDYPLQWRCGSVIGPDIAGQIYRRNFYGGLEQHMSVQFPVTFRYLGSDGCCFVLRNLVDQRPPDSPLYSVYAASLPGFLLGFDAFEDESLRHCSGMLAAIDFFAGNAGVAGQELEVQLRYYRLYNAILKAPIDHDDARAGLYRRPHWHPQVIATQPDDQVLLQADVGF